MSTEGKVGDIRILFICSLSRKEDLGKMSALSGILEDSRVLDLQSLVAQGKIHMYNSSTPITSPHILSRSQSLQTLHSSIGSMFSEFC